MNEASILTISIGSVFVFVSFVATIIRDFRRDIAKEDDLARTQRASAILSKIETKSPELQRVIADIAGVEASMKDKQGNK